MGSLSLSATAKQFPELRFTFTGLFVTPDSKAHPEADFSAWQTPLKAGVENTTALLDGKPVKLISLEYDQANQVTYEEYVGHQEVMITDYQPTGTLVLEAGTLRDFNPFVLAKSGKQVAFILTHGAAGNQVRWTTTALQIGRPTYADQNGTLTYSVPIRPVGSADQLITA